MELSDKDLQYYTHKIRNMIYLNTEDIEQLKKINTQQLIMIIATGNPVGFLPIFSQKVVPTFQGIP